MAPHPIEEITSPSSWALVSTTITVFQRPKFDSLGKQIEDKFSPFAKETLAKLITFVQVSPL